MINIKCIKCKEKTELKVVQISQVINYDTNNSTEGETEEIITNNKYVYCTACMEVDNDDVRISEKNAEIKKLQDRLERRDEIIRHHDELEFLRDKQTRALMDLKDIDEFKT